jgi:hypothetical protein
MVPVAMRSTVPWGRRRSGAFELSERGSDRALCEQHGWGEHSPEIRSANWPNRPGNRPMTCNEKAFLFTRDGHRL